MVEQRSPKPLVAGSSPAWPVFFVYKLRGSMSKIKQFLHESKSELRKVVWPSRNDVVSSVKVVIVSTIIIAVVLGLLDFVFTESFRAVMR